MIAGDQADGGTVDIIDKWIAEQIATPAGSIVFFVLVFLLRVSLDRWDRRRRSRAKPKPRKVVDG